MPPSQLKALKSQLHSAGVLGHQKSKKQRKSSARANPADRQARLQSVRDAFNPFELRPASGRPAKFPSASLSNGKYAAALHRPGAAKSAGEEARRRMLLPEMRRRHKVGGVVDRRIGEGVGGMTAEERAVARFAREKEGRGKVFDLEGSDGEEGGLGFGGLTHGGRAIDELEDDDMRGGSEGSGDEGLLVRKRRRSENEDEVGEDGGVTVDANGREVKKTKKEVMQEVLAKSKLHKYERQKAKEDDEDLRDLLDKGMADLLPLLRGQPVAPPKPQPAPASNGDGVGKVNPERQKLLDGMDRAAADRDYEKRLRDLARDTRAKPAERTKTAEEKAKDEAERVRAQEERRQKRMKGEHVSDDEADEPVEEARAPGEAPFLDDEIPGDAADFGFAAPAQAADVPRGAERAQQPDEDEFDFDVDLVASDPEDVELSEDESSAEEHSDDEEGAPRTRPQQSEADEEDEFVASVLGGANALPVADRNAMLRSTTTTTALPLTLPCPRTHTELLTVLKGTQSEQLPTILQRIRAQHHPSLAAANKEAMADFSAVLVEHLAWMGEQGQPLAVVEQVIRHLHSLSRTYATRIAEAFRSQMQGWSTERGVHLRKSALMVLVAVGSIYPTSDHFHRVVTPAMTVMGRWLAVNAPPLPVKGQIGKTLLEGKSEVGAFLVRLCVQWQALSKRVVPEALRFTERTMAVAKTNEARAPHLANLLLMADCWKDHTAFIEMFQPFLPLLQSSRSANEAHTLQPLLQLARQKRRPLELHHHRPQPLRTSIPKFEEGFNPDKHYDPDKERSEARKLRMEVKKEKKGAVRELRKDARFVAREQLREKRVADEEHKRRERRFLGEIAAEGR